MHIIKIELAYIQGLTHFKWDLKPAEARAGWHVFIGDNGTGKSSLLKAVAISLVAHENLPRNSLVGLIQHGKTQAKISTTTTVHNQWDSWSGNRANARVNDPATFHQSLTISQTNPNQGMQLQGRASGVQTGGFFSAMFGLDRRYGAADILAGSVSWLQDLHYRHLDELSKGISPSPITQFLQSLRTFINQDEFLPHGLTLHAISPSGVDFCDANGAIVDISALGAGFCSILGLTMELLRQLVARFGMACIFNANDTEVMPEGVVIVDDIDAHLHPRWQRAIGPWLTHHFPQMQFLVSTHSVFVCQAAVNGTVTCMPEPGSADAGGRLRGRKLRRLLYGDVVEALSSGAFGADVLTKQV